MLGDWNADGMTDVGIYKDGTWRFATSTGSSFQKDTIAQFGFGNGVPLSGEFNGDSLTDLATYDEGQWKVALGTGSGFSPASSFDLYMAEGAPVLAPNDVRWRVRIGSYDCGHDNYGCIPPGASGPCGQPSYQTALVSGSTSVAGRPVSVGGSGTISINGGQDHHCWSTISVYLRRREPNDLNQWRRRRVWLPGGAGWQHAELRVG